jgi:hypothetical protein
MKTTRIPKDLINPFCYAYSHMHGGLCRVQGRRKETHPIYRRVGSKQTRSSSKGRTVQIDGTQFRERFLVYVLFHNKLPTRLVHEHEDPDDARITHLLVPSTASLRSFVFYDVDNPNVTFTLSAAMYDPRTFLPNRDARLEL